MVSLLITQYLKTNIQAFFFNSHMAWFRNNNLRFADLSSDFLVTLLTITLSAIREIVCLKVTQIVIAMCRSVH